MLGFRVGRQRVGGEERRAVGIGRCGGERRDNRGIGCAGRGGGSTPGVAGAPTAKASETSKSEGAAGGSSAFCKDVLPPLADNQTKSGPPTAKDVGIWDHLDSEAPAGVKPDVDKVDQGLHEIQAGTAMSDVTGFGMAMQDILQWVGANCGLSPQ
ncbi:hypothetical protein ACU686_25760 [Yinghuangia aomiensis]